MKASDHGTPAAFEGVLLTYVLAKVDLPVGEKFHSTGAFYMVVEAKDGYRAVFAWSECAYRYKTKETNNSFEGSIRSWKVHGRLVRVKHGISLFCSTEYTPAEVVNLSRSISQGRNPADRGANCAP